jgi:hypothetical protein
MLPAIRDRIERQREDSLAGAGVLFPTTSLHLACMLWTIGAEPVMLDKSKDAVTPQGDPLTRWFYKGSIEAAEAIQLWNSPTPDIDWTRLTPRERALIIHVVRAFAKNLKWFFGHVKARPESDK